MILDQFGNQIKAPARPDPRPIATAKMVMSERDYVTAGLTPQRLAAVFRDADAGDISRQAELFEQIEEKDGHLRGESAKRINVITDVDFELAPATDSQRDLEVADFVRQHLLDMEDWPEVMTGLNQAIGRGVSMFEMAWEASAGQAIISDFKHIHAKRLLFTTPDGYVSDTPRLISDDALMGAEIPPWKTVMHRYGGKTGNATRAALYRICAWMFLFKNYSVKDWLIFTEVYGMPLRIGKYDPGASKDDKTALINAIKSIGTDAAGIISKSTEIEFIESVTGKDTGELYRSIVDFANEEMSKALLGQTTTAGLKDVGAYSAVESFKGVSMDLVKADSRALPATVRSQIIRPLVGFNYGWDTPLPLYRAVWDEDEDLNAKSEWVDKLLNRGVKMPAKWLREEFKIPEPEDGEETVGGNPPQPPFEKGGGANPTAAKLVAKAAGTGSDELSPDAADAFDARLNDAAEPVLRKMTDPVRRLVASAKSLQELRDGIFDLYPDIDGAEMADLMTDAVLAAKLAGMAEVDDE